jgi:hypothetical protein
VQRGVIEQYRTMKKKSSKGLRQRVQTGFQGFAMAATFDA